jgi:hypothetical protein
VAETKIPSIYRVPSNVEPELKRYLESVQEAVEVRLGRRGDELDQAVTYRDLIDSNLAQRASRLNRVIEPIIEEPTPSMPFNTIPQNVKASGAFTKILVTWDDHQMGSLFARAEIWRASIDDLNAATLQGSVYGSVFTDTVDYDTTMYYWVRFVQRATSVSGNETFGQFSSPAASATTAENISAVMTALSETLSDMPGYNLLSTTAAAATVIKQSSEPSTRVGGGALQANDIWLDTDNGQIYTRNASNNAWVAGRDSSLVTLYGSTSYTGSTITGAIATAQSDIVTVTNAQNSTASTVTSLNSTVSGHTSSISTLNTTTASHTGDLNAMYVLQVSTESNSSKSVAGMVIGSNASDGSGAQSYVQFQADKFVVWNGNDGNTAPFIVSSNTVYMANAMIQNGAITNAKIADATIETAKIVTLNADKIRSGTIEASTVLKIGSSGSGATDQRIEISASGNRILVVDDSS